MIKILVRILSIITFALLFATIFFDDHAAVEGNQVGKRVFFALACSITSGVSLLLTFKSKLKLSLLDLFVTIFGLYVLIHYNLTDSLAHTKIYIFGLLVALYWNMRIIVATDRKMTYLLIGVMLLSGIGESGIGIWQILVKGFSNHNLYKITGSFFNPGPYGGYMAVIAAISLSVIVNGYRVESTRKNKFNIKSIVFIIAIASFFCSLVVLPASFSRTAWVAFLAGCLVILVTQKRILTYLKSHKIYLIIASVLIMVGLVGAYGLKKDSAKGRLLLWEIGAKATLQKPLFGNGLGHFSASFGEAQQDYFASHKGNEMLAGSPEYAFNELIGLTVELGYIGLGLFLLIAALTLRGLFLGKFGRKDLAVGMVTLLVFSMASYPFSLLPFLILLTLMIACASDNLSGIKVNLLTRIMIVMLSLFLSINGALNVTNKPYREWRFVQILRQYDHHESTIDSYAALMPNLSDNPKFLFEYSQSLNAAKEYKRAIEIAKIGKRLSCDPMFYNIIGNNYLALHDYRNALIYYQKAYAILPARIYPLFLQVKAYAACEDHANVLLVGRKLLAHPDKVVSPATIQMRREVDSLIVACTKQ